MYAVVFTLYCYVVMCVVGIDAVRCSVDIRIADTVANGVTYTRVGMFVGCVSIVVVVVLNALLLLSVLVVSLMLLVVLVSHVGVNYVVVDVTKCSADYVVMTNVVRVLVVVFASIITNVAGAGSWCRYRCRVCCCYYMCCWCCWCGH